MKFTSTMGAVNYMAKRGWKLDRTVFCHLAKIAYCTTSWLSMLRATTKLPKALNTRPTVNKDKLEQIQNCLRKISSELMTVKLY